MSVKSDEKAKIRKPLTLARKMEIINQLKANARQVDIVKSYGLPKQTVFTIWQNRDKIEQACLSGQAKESNMRLRSASQQDLERAVVTWYQDEKLEGKLITRGMLREKAEEIANGESVNKFVATESWIEAVIHSHDLILSACRAKRSLDLNDIQLAEIKEPTALQSLPSLEKILETENSAEKIKNESPSTGITPMNDKITGTNARSDSGSMNGMVVKSCKSSGNNAASNGMKHSIDNIIGSNLNVKEKINSSEDSGNMNNQSINKKNFSTQLAAQSGKTSAELQHYSTQPTNCNFTQQTFSAFNTNNAYNFSYNPVTYMNSVSVAMQKLALYHAQVGTLLNRAVLPWTVWNGWPSDQQEPLDLSIKSKINLSSRGTIEMKKESAEDDVTDAQIDCNDEVKSPVTKKLRVD